MREYIADIPDFPKKGIMFRDISPLLREKFPEVVRGMSALFTAEEWNAVDYLAGVESRGFILAAGLAMHQQKGLIKIRKKGKLPGPVISKAYGLEYGQDVLEMQPEKGRILIVDDVLASGGTLTAAADVAKEAGYEVRGLTCLIDLVYLNDFCWHGLKARSLIRYEN